MHYSASGTSARDREKNQQQGTHDNQQYGDEYFGSSAVGRNLIALHDGPTVGEKSETRQKLHEHGECNDTFSDNMHERGMTQADVPVDGVGQIVQEKVKLLNEESECHERDDSSDPGQESPFVGGVIVEVGYHMQARGEVPLLKSACSDGVHPGQPVCSNSEVQAEGDTVRIVARNAGSFQIDLDESERCRETEHKLVVAEILIGKSG